MTEKSAHGVKTEEDKNADKISLGTLGMDAKSAMEPEASDEEKMYDENGSLRTLYRKPLYSGGTY